MRNATFHDGKPVTSADVKFTRGGDSLRSSWQSRLGRLDSIETPDEYTVVFKLKQPFSALIFMLDMGSGGPPILPKHLYEGTGIPNNPYNQKPIGSGPFKLVSWEKGNQIVLERNENYFKKGLPYLDRIIMRIMADQTALALAIENGEIDYAPVGLSFSDAERLKELENIDVVYSGREGLGVLLTLVMNLDNPISANQKVMQSNSYPSMDC
ncbi:peptide/opine/nickel ABC uptake transporter, putative substrate-binding protein [Candidatus Nitrososphaera gargensis Ga9.2]|uniref:Peptide/opine/nickel ABC uptake transporter, putative substrate-binding protein n=1 Tax=Nitrososphaera gargensis (strain Ga9.2) TaxID=1237085 RepID=K0IM73_NITGG|nr:peptide/opine/nickel ABC uptake transporter, putative substrate-binding protein [Candidatus Nitrososphaera gargensis Ga9.2]